ncbi:conserved CBS domain protein, partial [Trypanosoma grayi]|uniref:conserved CBS domain protein n=1 Tax=Trypanosoma grayi TaxID=71804 RepID=UPI0004F495AC
GVTAGAAAAAAAGAVGAIAGAAGENSPDGVDPADFDVVSGDVALPLHVRNLLLAPADGETSNPLTDFGKEPRVGPYRAIVDVPFCYVPQLGRHRSRPISVTLDTPLLEALRLILLHDIECIAVVSEEQIIVDVIDRSDVVRIEDQGVYDTNLTVRAALGGKVSSKICVFHAKDALRDIFIHFVRQRVKELFLVDPDTDKLLGQLNVGEVVFFLVFGVTTTSGNGTAPSSLSASQKGTAPSAAPSAAR